MESGVAMIDSCGRQKCGKYSRISVGVRPLLFASHFGIAARIRRVCPRPISGSGEYLPASIRLPSSPAMVYNSPVASEQEHVPFQKLVTTAEMHALEQAAVD